MIGCSSDSRTSAWTTRKESVPCHSRQTATHGNVVVHVALRVLTASSRTRVYAFIANTGLSQGTVVVEDTLRSAAYVGVSLVVGETSAATFGAHCIWTTRTGVAGIGRSRWLFQSWIINNFSANSGFPRRK